MLNKDIDDALSNVFSARTVFLGVSLRCSLHAMTAVLSHLDECDIPKNTSTL